MTPYTMQVTETETHLMYEEAEYVPAQNVGRLRQGYKVLKDTILFCVAKYFSLAILLFSFLLLLETTLDESEFCHLNPLSQSLVK